MLCFVVVALILSVTNGNGWNDSLILISTNVSIACTLQSPCHNMIILSSQTAQYFSCYNRACQNTTILLTRKVEFSVISIENVDIDNNNETYIPIMNIDIYTAADYTRIRFATNARAKNVDIYVGSIYGYLSDWISLYFASFDTPSQWEPLSSGRGATLYLYANENGFLENVNVYCNGSTDECIVAAPQAGSNNAINDVQIYCSITQVNSTSVGYPNNIYDGILSPEYPKCIFWCTTNQSCIVKFFLHK